MLQFVSLLNLYTQHINNAHLREFFYYKAKFLFIIHEIVIHYI